MSPSPHRFVLATAGLLLVALGAAQAQNKDSTWLKTNFQSRTYTSTSPSITMAYRLYKPVNYDPSRKYPIVVALHGVGERGTDNTIQLTREELAQPWVRDSVQAKYPHFVMIPQCPTANNQYWWPWNNWAGTWNGTWSGTRSTANAAIISVLDSLKREFSLDTTRFYIAGLSMGGFGTFELMKWNPTVFAAAVPAAGGADTSATAISAMAQTPFWIFHGASDPTINVNGGSRKVVRKVEDYLAKPAVRFVSSANQVNPTAISLDSLRKAVYVDGANYLYSEITGGVHNSGWLEAWRHPMLTDWVFSKRKVNGVSVSIAPSVAPRAFAPANVTIVMRGGVPLLEKSLPGGGSRWYTLEGKLFADAGPDRTP